MCFDVDLHYRYELDFKIKPKGAVDYNEECRWAEDYDVICGEKTDIFILNKF